MATTTRAVRTPRAARKLQPAKARLPKSDSLRLSQELLRHLPSGIVYFDRLGRLEEINPAARAALDFSHPRGVMLEELFRDADLHEADGALLGPAASLMRDSYRSLRILQRKVMAYTTPQGVGRRLGVTFFPLREGEHTSGLVCLLTDLTAIHSMEEELQRRRNLSALGEMAAGIAHEFKNGLATISGYAQMVQKGLEDAPRAQVAKILEQVGMLTDIATEFLMFARPLPLQPEAVDLGKLLRQCADSLGVQEAPALEIAVDAFFPRVTGDPVLLASALMNLLRNACESIRESGQGGRVSVQFGGSDDKRARILFVDDGPGMAPEVADKIFIPFFTTKARGTGLGLSMVHKIITAHQGSVLLADASAGHTVFAVLLPLARSN